jgi:hypothetical protein
VFYGGNQTLDVHRAFKQQNTVDDHEILLKIHAIPGEVAPGHA